MRAHRGSVLARGFVLDPAIAGDAEVRRRVLAAWQPGAQVHRIDGRIAILLPVPVRVRAHAAPGAPLVADGDLLVEAPLTAVERTGLGAAAGALVLVHGGVARALVPGEQTRVDPAGWLAVDRYAVVDVESLAAPPPAPVGVALAERREARQVLAGAVGEAAPGAAGAAAALARARRRARGEEAGERDAEIEVVGAGQGRSRIAAGWRRVVTAVARWLGRAAAPALPAAGAGAAGAPREAISRRRWRDRWRDWVARRVMRGRLGAWLGRQQARYLQRMLQLFDEGKLDEALRHAIPLGRDGDEPGGPMLGVPRPRERVDLQLARRAAGGGALQVIHDAYELMRQRYRAALARLDAGGRAEEAAFVLAELLGDEEGAVALLERHGRLRLAAELAEARALAPGLVIRQWFLARDHTRALAVAVRTGAFADAVLRLDRTHPGAARLLRRQWARVLAERGDFAAAVDAVWPAAGGDLPVVDWIERAIAAGGTAGARMLGRLVGTPGSWPRARPHLEALLAAGEDQQPARAELARALAGAPAGEQVRTAARHTARALLRDIGHGIDLDGAAVPLLGQLVRVAGDGALRADRPPLPTTTVPPSAPAGGAVPRQLRLDRGDAGALPVTDAAILPSRRLLVALGEAGVRVVDPDGRVRAHFDQPADHLVVADAGTRAIAMARRGQVWRLARIDLAGGRAGFWCEAELSCFTSTFDGLRWFAARGRELLAIDPSSDRLRSLWGVPDLGAPITAIDRDETILGCVSRGEQDGELWLYELPGPTLRRRLGLDPEHAATATTVHDAIRLPAGEWTGLIHHPVSGPDAPPLPSWAVAGSGWRVAVGAGPVRPPGFTARSRWCAAAVPLGSDLVIQVVHVPVRQVVAQVSLEGARRAALRFGELELLIGDDRGRVLLLDLRTGRLRRDLRMRP